MQLTAILIGKGQLCPTSSEIGGSCACSLFSMSPYLVPYICTHVCVFKVVVM